MSSYLAVKCEGCGETRTYSTQFRSASSCRKTLQSEDGWKERRVKVTLPSGFTFTTLHDWCGACVGNGTFKRALKKETSV